MRQLNEMDVQWCVRRLPKEVKALLTDHPKTLCVAGGFIRAVIAREDVSDIDLFSDTVDNAHAMARSLNGLKHRRLVVTENADTVYGEGLPVQFIHRWTYSEASAAVASFDFTICASAIWWNGKAWDSLCCDSFYEDLAAKRLVYLSPIRNEAAGGSLLRVLKYYQRGYRITMPSFAAVLTRMLTAVDAGDYVPDDKKDDPSWKGATKQDIILGLLREVDPLVAVTTADADDHQHIEQ